MPRLAHVAAVIGGLLIATACGDSNEPNGDGGSGPLHVRLLENSATSVYAQDNFAIAACVVTYSGKSDQSISWRHLRFIFYADSQMTVPFDTAVAGAADLGSSWSGDFGGVEEPYSSWSLSATIPFAVRAEFFYLSGGVQSSSEPIDATCLVPTPPNPGPPELSNVHLSEDGDGVIRANEPVTVGFHLEAPAGSWQGYLEVWGAGTCDTVLAVAQPPEVSLDIGKAILLPPSCAGIDTVHAGVTYFDVLGRSTSQQTLLPTFTPDITAPTAGFLYPPELGERFIGDTLDFQLAASDNRALAWVVWEVTPTAYRDSARVTGRDGGVNLRLGMRPEFIGVPNLSLRFRARDSVGLESGWVSTAPGAFNAYPTSTPVSLVSRTIPGDVRRALIDSKRDRVYLVEGNTAKLTVLTASTLGDVASLPTYGMQSIDFSASGDSLVLVAPAAGKMGIINLTAATLAIDTFSYGVTGGGAPGVNGGVVVLNNGKAYVTGAADEVVEVDLASHTGHFLAGPVMGFLARSGDRSKAVVTTGGQMTTFTASTGTLGSLVTEPWTDHVRMDQSGNRVAVGLKVFDGAFTLLRSVIGPFTYDLANTPRIALSGDGGHIYYPDYQRSIVHGSTVTGRSVERFRLPFARAFELVLGLTDDGSTLLYSDVQYGNPTRIVVMKLH